ncbi:sporulation membrane protein YtaF [Paenibacillus sp. N1-5-1-14]|uniref:sporulation membrane protein YtaF n=1 Tax=Paenibacillus radicibacter TaxID=2972488 RepID=UPI002159826E|nr:sporulation membrane protein YtaF [Paenibacillus radicibacter]MCR8645715.1 sporulation membrane protein YtaF [Paenibacillus radicibacter]
MHILSILLVAIASNLDNLGIGLSFGMKSTRIPFWSNFMIALITMTGTYLSMIVGEWISEYVSADFANLAGALVIAIIGLQTIWSSLRPKKVPELTDGGADLVQVLRHPIQADTDQNQTISWKESLALGVALALNNIATGIGAGATGISPIWTTISAGIFSYLFVGFGVQFGLKLGQTRLGSYSNILAGLLLIGIAIYEVLV